MRPSGGFRQKRLVLTPLIDVIFLLLLFFMLSSTFTRFNEINLSAPGSGSSAQTPPGTTVFLRLTAQGISLNGTPVAPDDLAQRLTQAAQPGPARAIVSLSGAVTSQSFIDILARLRAVPDLPVTVLQ